MSDDARATFAASSLVCRPLNLIAMECVYCRLGCVPGVPKFAGVWGASAILFAVVRRTSVAVVSEKLRPALDRRRQEELRRRLALAMPAGSMGLGRSYVTHTKGRSQCTQFRSAPASGAGVCIGDVCLASDGGTAARRLGRRCVWSVSWRVRRRAERHVGVAHPRGAACPCVDADGVAAASGSVARSAEWPRTRALTRLNFI